MNEPGSEGVPESFPVAGSNVTPSGSAPVRVQVKGTVPSAPSAAE